MRVHIVLAASFLVLTLCGQGNAQAVSEQEMRKRVAALEQENRALKAQMQMLQKELEEVRAALAKAKQEAALPEVAASQPGTGEQRTSVDRRAVLADVMQMLREMPDDLLPHPETGWDKFTQPKAAQWLGDHMLGRQFETQLALAQKPNAVRDQLGKPGDWTAILPMERIRTRFMGVDFVQVIDSLRLYGDEAFGRRVDNMQVGHLVRFRGRIHEVALRWTGSQCEVRVTLEPWELISPELQGARTVAK